MTTKKRANETSASIEFDELRRKIRREGALEAFAALRAVANDKSAPAAARAAASSSIFRAAGLFEKSDGTDDNKPLSAMTPAELDRAVREAERGLKRAAKTIENGGAARDVFD